MKPILKLKLILALFVATTATNILAQLTVPSDGSDGMLNITTNTVIDLSQAVSGSWYNSDAANTGKGIYDSSQWAVVFKYSCVNIASGATVTFANHPTHAPVIWLVQSNVNITGTVSLNGQYSSDAVPQEYTPAEPGPGGFRGGALSPAGNGDGYGPGGAPSGPAAAGYLNVYGNPQILPLIGGSGTGCAYGYSGLAGGGAILVVAGGTVTINGQLTATGPGQGFAYTGGEGSAASGGAIRIVASQILGSGTVDASGGGGSGLLNNSGRTRMEANLLSTQLNIFPNTIAVAPGTAPVIFPPTNAPTVQIISVGSQPAPSDPVAAVISSADVGIQTTNAVKIVLQTRNLPIEGVVALHIIPKYSSGSFLNASYVSGDVNQATWQVSTVLPAGFCVLQARATAP